MNRPVNLSLQTMRFPITAIVSILHRASGVILFLFIPVLLCFFSCSLESAEEFERVRAFLSGPLITFLLWGFLAALLYHLLAGLRHLVMDLGFAETLSTAKVTALTVFILFGLGVISLGVWLWA